MPKAGKRGLDPCGRARQRRDGDRQGESHDAGGQHAGRACAAGGYSDPPGKEGAAALCARVLDRGTVSRPADVIADDLDGRGASLSVATGRHQIAISATCLTDDFAAVLALAADIARHPAFPGARSGDAARGPDHLDPAGQDDPASMAVDAFMRALYGTIPTPRKVRGTVEIGRGAQARRTWSASIRRGFSRRAITVVVVGDVDEEAADRGGCDGVRRLDRRPSVAGTLGGARRRRAADRARSWWRCR